MTQRSFVAKREQDWKELERLLTGSRTTGRAADGSSRVTAGGIKGFFARRQQLRERAAWFPQAFRQLTGDLNTARSNGFDPALIERLNRITLEGNQILYSSKPFSIKTFSAFIFKTFPRALRSQWKSFSACFFIFFGLAVFSALLCIRFPDFINELMSPWQASMLEEMYNPESSHYLKPREVSTDADMFGYYIFNNISIAFRTFAGGLLAGVGSLLILAVNGIFIGAAAGHIINCGYQNTFFSFVIGHSAFELTAIIISAQAGFLLGYRLFITRGLSRGASLREAGKTALPLISGCTIMLVIAAVIEAFWSSRHEIDQTVRFAAGFSAILLVIIYIVFAGRFSSAPDGRQT